MTRLFTARMKLGMFDPPEMVPYTKIDEKQARQRRNTAPWPASWPTSPWCCSRTTAVLPLKTSGVKIAVVGPLADQTKVLLGNYNGTPTHTVSVLEGLHDGVLRRDHQLRSGNAVPGPAMPSRFPPSVLSVDGKPGIKASYSKLDMAT